MMKRLLSIALLVGMSGFGQNLMAQSTQRSGSLDQNSEAQEAQQHQAQMDTQSAREFEGKIAKAGGRLVLKDSLTHQAYQLDDQKKAKQYEGKDVRVTATIDPNTNTLHVVDIAAVEK